MQSEARHEPNRGSCGRHGELTIWRTVVGTRQVKMRKPKRPNSEKHMKRCNAETERRREASELQSERYASQVCSWEKMKARPIKLWTTGLRRLHKVKHCFHGCNSPAAAMRRDGAVFLP
eukprot:6176726-Pleurochrysis_carterae.AAC.3